MKKIAILGCGWFGKVLAQRLQEDSFDLVGSAKTKNSVAQIQSLNIKAYQIEIGKTNASYLIGFFSVDCLIISFPLQVQEKAEIAVMSKWFQQFHNLPKHVLLISSTSVYQPNGKTVCEESELQSTGKGSLLACFEKELKMIFGARLTVFRFAGLFGKGRKPGSFLAGKKNIPQANAPVNLLHITDAVNITKITIEAGACSRIFNICGDLHPTKAIFYSKAAHLLQLPSPIFLRDEGASLHKIIDNSKVKQHFNFCFKFTNNTMQSIID